MIITAIEEYDKKRKKIYIDNMYAFCLYVSEIRKLHLEENDEIDETVYKEINDIIYKRVMARTLYILKAAPKTEKQLKDKLTDNGYTEEQVRIGIDYARKFGYVNDRKYAEAYIESMCQSRSRKDIEQRLFTRGISKKIIDDVFREIGFDDTDAIMKALAKKSVTKEKFSAMDYSEKQRIYAYLFRKGFSFESINATLNLH